MTRYTVDYGIDLGTTNSAIACAEGDDAGIVRNNKGHEYTPSAIHMGRTGNIKVGEAARDRVETDAANTCAEFKRMMGTPGEHKTFQAAGRSMTPEELSAEVLKSLRGDVLNKMGEQLESAVITVPAAFELDQCDATRNAAKLAGINFCPLLQEPTAAAWAYSAHHAPSRAFWLVYDYGGGTFDAAVVKVDDGEFSVLNHAGDNHLGGKDVDWALVDNLLIPRARAEYGLTSLDRNNRREGGNIAKLKAAAEHAKIALSTAEVFDVEADLKSPDGELIMFETTMTRSDVEQASRPFIERTIMLSRQALNDRGLGADDVERVVLVGGMTQSPLLRQMLADPVEGLGIELDHSLDPVTVVARGAAIFAGTQQIPKSALPQTQPVAGQVELELTYSSAGPDLDPAVGGTVRRDGTTDWTGWTIEFDNPDAQPPWNSGKVPLTAEGGFGTRLRAAADTTSVFRIVLRDPTGTPVAVDRDEVGYRQTPITGGAPTLSHSVGVGLADNSVEPLLAKDRELPAKASIVLHTTVTVSKDSNSGLIRVPVLSGEQERADRNTPIGILELTAGQVKRSVPMGSEIEVSIKINTSFEVEAYAYIPLLDEEYDINVDLHRSDTMTPEQLRAETDKLRARHAKLGTELEAVSAPDAQAAMDEFDRTEILADVDRLLGRADMDADAGSACLARIREANTKLDRVEDAIELPKAIDEAKASLTGIKELVETQGSTRDQAAYREAAADLEAAIASGEVRMINRKLEVLRGVGVDVLRDTGQLDAIRFGLYEEELSNLPDPMVQRALTQGRTALLRNDRSGLAAAVRDLQDYYRRNHREMPADPSGGTVRREPR